MVYLRDFAETLLNHQQSRDHRGTTLLMPCRPRAGLAGLPSVNCRMVTWVCSSAMCT